PHYQSALTQLAATERDLMQNRFGLQSLRKELALLQDRDNPSAQPHSDPGLDPQAAPDAAYLKLQSRKTQLEEEMSRITNVANPAMRDQLLGERPNQLRAIEAELAAMRRALRAAAENQQRLNLEMRVAIAEDQEKQMAAEFARQQAAVQRWAEALRRP